MADAILFRRSWLRIERGNFTSVSQKNAFIISREVIKLLVVGVAVNRDIDLIRVEAYINNRLGIVGILV